MELPSRLFNIDRGQKKNNDIITIIRLLLLETAAERVKMSVLRVRDIEGSSAQDPGLVVEGPVILRHQQGSVQHEVQICHTKQWSKEEANVVCGMLASDLTNAQRHLT